MKDKYEICRIDFNWFYSTEVGEEYQTAELNKYGVVKIEEIPPRCEGDRNCYAVHMKNGWIKHIYNVNRAYLRPTP